MTLDNLLLQMLNGLASASTLFLLASGLSLIFGVSRIVNFAHGSLYMAGIYLAYSIITAFGTGGIAFWAGILVAALAVAALGVFIEVVVLRRIYHAPELIQLLATFAVALIIRDIALYFWGPEEISGPRAPGLTGGVTIFGQLFPVYSLLMIAAGPVVFAGLWLLLRRTRWGILIRAATQDRHMVAALGVNQVWLFTSVFALGAFLAGLAGALQIHNEAASLEMDLRASVDAFVVVVVGGLGSVPGAYLAALIIAEARALCTFLGTVEIFGFRISFADLTLVVDFAIMAAVLVLRPYGLLGKRESTSHDAHIAPTPLNKARRSQRALGVVVLALVALSPLLSSAYPYLPTLSIELLIAALFAGSLYFILGPGGMVSFGHAAFFGLAAYGAGIASTNLGLPVGLAMVVGVVVAMLAAIVFGWFSVRLSGVYMAMLTLALAQLAWSIVFQWDDFTGGSNGLVGIWPPEWLGNNVAFFYFALVIVVASMYAMRRMLFSGFGYSLRAARDSSLRSDAIGINVKRVQWVAFVLAGAFCGIAGTVFVFSKGSISPNSLQMAWSLDGLIMILLGGAQAWLGPIVGSTVFTVLKDSLARESIYWGGMLGVTILVLIQLMPTGIVGVVQKVFVKRSVQ
ncbi:ABC transporter permease [Pusillimonas noertemannii]|uniref:ABC transporter permease n=1 Tax=Pusillimonas noertemannii TaxID=305977 RepID=UPI00333FC8A8